MLSWTVCLGCLLGRICCQHTFATLQYKSKASALIAACARVPNLQHSDDWIIGLHRNSPTKIIITFRPYTHSYSDCTKPHYFNWRNFRDVGRGWCLGIQKVLPNTSPPCKGLRCKADIVHTHRQVVSANIGHSMQCRFCDTCLMRVFAAWQRRGSWTVALRTAAVCGA